MSGILGCVQRVDGTNVFLTNARSFTEGMMVTVMRDLKTQVGDTEVRRVYDHWQPMGALRLWPKVDVKAGDLILYGGWGPDSN